MPTDPLKCRVVGRPVTEMTEKRVDELLAKLRPETEEGRETYFMEDLCPLDVDEAFIHSRLMFHWDEYDTYDEVAPRVRGELADYRIHKLLPGMPTPETVLADLMRLTDAERFDLFSQFCVHCGSAEPRCNCMRDD